MPDMHDRLVQLERLVKSIARKPSASLSQDSSNLSQQAEILHLDNPIDVHRASELHYISGDHWAAIMDGIADIKDHFDREEQLGLENSPDRTEDYIGDVGNLNIHANRNSLLLYGGYQSASKAEILAALPPKGAVDRYISRYFNSLDLVSCKCAVLTKLQYDREFV